MSHAEGLRSFEQHVGQLLYTSLDQTQHKFMENFRQRLESHPTLKEAVDEILVQAQLALPPHNDSLATIHKSQLSQSTTVPLPKRFRNVRCQAKRISQATTLQTATQQDIAQGGFLSHPSHIKSKFVAETTVAPTPPLYDLAMKLAVEKIPDEVHHSNHPNHSNDPTDEIDLEIDSQKLSTVYIKEEDEDYYYDTATNLLFIEEVTGNYLAVGIFQVDHPVEWFP